jgi:hypothetical protein
MTTLVDGVPCAWSGARLLVDTQRHAALLLLLQAAAKQAPQLTREQMAEMRRANDPTFKPKAKEAKGKGARADKGAAAGAAGPAGAAAKAAPGAAAAATAPSGDAGGQGGFLCCCDVHSCPWRLWMHPLHDALCSWSGLQHAVANLLANGQARQAGCSKP